LAHLYVGTLWISSRVGEKLVEKHELTADQVRAAVVNTGALPFYWDHHPARGSRAIVTTVIAGQSCLVVLYPAEGQSADVWRLGSAYPL
jgi:hypothetical protein